MADTKISALTADTDPTSDDELVTVNDPGGTPANRRATATNLITKAHGLSDGIIEVASGVMGVATAGTDYVSPAGTETLTNKTIDGDNNTLSNLDLGNEVDWAAADDVTTRTAFASGDKVLIFEAGVGMRKVDYDDLPGAGGGLSNIVEDVTPQLGGQLDVNGQAIGDGTNELLTFVEDASAVNNLEVENQATGSGPILRATGDDANVELNLDTKGTADVNVLDNLDVTGNITLTGTVDGRDVATDGTKLDGVETSADVTDATNVAAAGAVMDSDISEAEGFMRKTGAGAYEAIKSNLAASTAPTATDDSASGYAVGSIWIDTTADKAYVCLDATATSAVWTETTQAGGGISNVVEDTTPQLGGMLDVNGNAIGDGTRELLTFTEDASAVNQVNIENQATGSGPIISAAGDDANVDLNLAGKGTGNISIGNFTFDADQTVGAGQDNYVLTYDNTGGLISLEAAAGGGGQAVYDYIIAPSGGDYTTLTAYFADAPAANDRIFIEEGTYTETATVSSTLEGLTIHGAGREETILQFGTNEFRPTGNYLQMSNLRIESTTGKIDVQNCEYGFMENVHFYMASNTGNDFNWSIQEGMMLNCMFENVNGSTSQGVMTGGGARGTYVGCQFTYRTGGTGTNTTMKINTIDGKFINCYFFNNASAAGSSLVYLQNDNNLFSNCKFRDIYGSVDRLIEIPGSGTFNRFTNCQFLGGDDEVLFIDGDGTGVTNCHVETADNAAVPFDIDASWCNVGDNFVYHTGTPSGDLFNIAGSDNIFSDNTSLATFSSMTVASGDRNVIANNSVQGVTLTDSGTNTINDNNA